MPYDQIFGHEWYLWKDNKKTKLHVKKSSDLNVWVKSYDQKMDFDFLENIKIHFLASIFYPDIQIT